MGDYHVRFCERFGVKLPLSTRPRWNCTYHIVFIPKYRKKQLYGQLRMDVGYLKGKSTLMIYDRHPELQSKWSKAFWARGYYVATVGNITEEAITKYIREQLEESRKEDNQGAAL